MRLELLGTGGYFPNEARHTAGYLLPETGVLFDAGTSASRVAGKLEREELDLFLSHAHIDHIVGLTYLLVPILEKKITTARLHARPQDLEAVQKHLFSKSLFPVEIPFELHELTNEISLPGEAVLKYCDLEHPGGTVGYRIDWPDRSLAYITDTVANGSYTEFVHGVDLLLHECYFPDEKADLAQMTGHSYASQVGQIAQEAQVGELVLIHFDPFADPVTPVDLTAVRKIFPNTTLGEDLTTIEF